MLRRQFRGTLSYTVMLTTLLSILSFNQALFAQHGNGNHGGGNHGNGNHGNGNHNGGSGDTFTIGGQNQNWEDSYKGRINFKLSDDSKLFEAKKMVRRMERELEVKSSQFETIKSALKALESKKSAQVSKRDKAVAKIDSAKAEKTALTTQKQTLASQMATLKTQIASLTTKINQLAPQVEALRQTVATEKENVSNLLGAHREAKRILKLQMDQCLATETQVACNQKPAIKQLKMAVRETKELYTQANLALAAMKTALKEMDTKLARLNSQKDQKVASKAQKKTKHDAIPAKIAQLNTNIRTYKAQKEAAKTQILRLNPQISSKRRSKQQAKVAVEMAASNVAMAQQAKRAIKDQLISRILEENERGFSMGRGAGRSEGEELASRRGNQYGEAHGLQEGRAAGEDFGKQRDYNIGERQGEEKAKTDANVNGKADGTRIGRSQGNKRAGQLQGNSDGIANAIASDAARKGAAEGATKGMDEAISYGMREGYRIGEAQAISNEESKPLTGRTVNGPFAGTFAHYVPGYPENGSPHLFYDSSYATRIRRRLPKTAFLDGYRAGYHRASQRAYERLIDGIYTQAKDYYYEEAYTRALEVEYTASFDRGHRYGYGRLYSPNYERVKEYYRGRAYSQYLSSPDLGSRDYKDSYASAKSSAYRQKYAQIKAASLEAKRSEVFNSNKAGQTEIYRKKRYASATKTYKNYPVLSFVKSTLSDHGITKVGAADAKYQPGENVSVDIIIKNTGHKTASGVSVTLASGERATLPAIAGKSTVTVKGAIATAISGGQQVGSTFQTSLSLKYLLKSNDSIQGAFYDQSGQSLVASGRKNSKSVSYPFNLSMVSIRGEIILGGENDLSVSVKNQSARSYDGDLQVELNSSIGDITSELSQLSHYAKGTSSLTGAKILVDGERNLFSKVYVSATISKNGVLLGSTTTDAVKLVKTLFKNKKGVPTIVADSESAYSELKDLMAELGGMDSFAVLDLSLGSANKKILDAGLSGKVALVIDSRNSSSSIAPKISGLFKASNSSVVFVDTDDIGLSRAKSKTPGFKSSVNFRAKLAKFGTVNLYASNPLSGNGIKRVNAFQGSLKEIEKSLSLARLLAKSDSALLEFLATNLKGSALVSPQQTLLANTQLAMTRALQDILMADKLYNRSASQGLRAASSSTAMIMKIASAAKSFAGSKKTGANILLQISDEVLDEAFSHHDPIEDVVSSKIESAVKKALKKPLKNSDKYFKKIIKKKDLLKSAEKQAYRFAPFAI
ncbi:MAG: hypothetical protein HOE90_21845 [Bacteriovoracaceae bacterium]|nr:hypothetical protein [Bacteriovoracaceae bacterium]